MVPYPGTGHVPQALVTRTWPLLERESWPSNSNSDFFAIRPALSLSQQKFLEKIRSIGSRRLTLPFPPHHSALILSQSYLTLPKHIAEIFAEIELCTLRYRSVQRALANEMDTRHAKD
ncbi:hypothetical protein BgiMline_008274 [Biomphalaria glabrata]|nr:hypothetical protein BgiMline_018846 [Biomphalaria glabrata]KAI8788798.1 hypothetical protein BgiBS90_011466 [Biomphalaria glabrata]